MSILFAESKRSGGIPGSLEAGGIKSRQRVEVEVVFHFTRISDSERFTFAVTVGDLASRIEETWSIHCDSNLYTICQTISGSIL
ncbi:hypothetical protein L204_106436 [Cryptococcus depauperatus]